VARCFNTASFILGSFGMYTGLTALMRSDNTSALFMFVSDLCVSVLCVSVLYTSVCVNRVCVRKCIP